MPPLVSRARLPDEVIVEVFKNYNLDEGYSKGYLRQWCLVSRRFLDHVRQLLYEEIKVEVCEVYFGVADDRFNRYEFGEST